MSVSLNFSVRARVGQMDLEATTSIDLSAGVVGLIGESAAGKSSLLKVLAGLKHTAQMRASFEGWTWTATSKEAAPCVYVSNTYTLFEHLTVSENLRFIEKHSVYAHYCRIPLEGLISQLHLSSLLKKMPSDLSGGETQRVLIARALLSGKPILFLDEVFSALDWRTRQYLMHLLSIWHKEYKRHFVVVSHSMQDLAFCCSSAVLMQKGTLGKQTGINSAIREYINKDYEGLFAKLAVKYHNTNTVHGVHEYQVVESQQSVFQKCDERSQILPESLQYILVDANKVSLRFPPRALSSMLNSLQVTVSDIEPHKNGAVIHLDVDGQTLFAVISKKSLDLMAVKVGDVLLAEFKA
ncbi:ATP-binding cassette domain-containing protein [Agaribacter flavus]|uniref:ATP-binding cassette domain-containing protein n=1 Tax=Agaribacter flavus TaxID=1902781 RepID=A0ABV7FS21_9ALTE